ncbi:MAG: carboxypeptidase regulatory-like domain-containing protein [Pyrinomonadaceae bacterium]
MKQVFRLSVALIALVIACGANAFAQTPTPTPTPSPTPSNPVQLTSSNRDSFASDISGDGRYIVVASAGDIGTEMAGTDSDNTDNNYEIFLVDFQTRITYQITHTRHALKNASGSTTDRDNIAIEIVNKKPVISHDGRWIAFGSNATLSGTTLNPGNFNGTEHTAALSSDANTEIFLYQIPVSGDLSDGTFFRITDTPASIRPHGGTTNAFPIYADDNYNPALNDNATALAFVSTRDLAPGHNDEEFANPEIFVYNRGNGVISQVTETEGTFTFNDNPSINGAAPPPSGSTNSVIAFISNANITGNNSDGNSEIHYAIFNGSVTTAINQVTTTTASSTTPIVNVLNPGRRLSRNGNLIAFESTANLDSDNAIQSTFAIFVYNIAADTFTPVGQRSTPGTELAFRFPTFTGDNSTLVFSSALNFNTNGTIATSGGLNPDRLAQIFATPVPQLPGTPVVLTRLTNTPSQNTPGQGQPPIQAYPSDTIERIAFSTIINFTTGNSDNTVEAFLLTTTTTPPPAALHSISGQVKVGTTGPALSGVTVTLTSSTAGFAARTTQTNSAGNYAFTNLPAGRSYMLKSTKTNYTFTPSQKSFSSLTTNQTTNFTAAERTYTISGRLINVSGAGISGVTVKLSGTRNLTATTNSNGGYTFSNLPAGGNYTVKPTFGGMSFDPLTKSFSNLTANQTTTANFKVVYRIIGRVMKKGTTAGLQGVTVKLSGSRTMTATTDANGNYKFDNLPAGGNYRVLPVMSGMGFSPGSQSFNALGANRVASTFSATPN